MPNSSYFLDGRLIPRIKQILRGHKTQPSVSQLTEQLQAQYGEYNRKKKIVFMKSVEKGIDIAVRELLKEGFDFADNQVDSDSEADLESDSGKDKNIMNYMISSMYRKSQPALPEINGARSNTDQNFSQVGGEPRQPSFTLPHEGNLSSTPAQSGWYIDRRKSGSKIATDKSDFNGGLDLSVNGRNNDSVMNESSNLDKRDETKSLSKGEKAKKRRRETSPDGLRRNKKQKQIVSPTVNFSNVGGNESVLQHLRERCQFLEYPELLPRIKGDLPKSFLIHGPTGCGKTLLANAIAGEYQLPLLSMTATELVGGISGDSEANIRDLFQQAADIAPCVLLIDDVDAIAAKRELATKGMESRVVTQLSNSMDELRSKNLPVLMICATNRPNSLDEAFRRTGRFDIEYALRFPNRDARKSILQALCGEVQLAEDVELSELADLTPGYVGCDLKTLICITNACALHRVIAEYKQQDRFCSLNINTEGAVASRHKVVLSSEEIEQFSLRLTKADFQKAMTEVKPTAKQEDVILVPNTTWDDIGGLDNIRKKLNLCIMERARRPELYQAVGMTSAVGVLLVGPPGCGKTSVARAVANEAGINFLYIKGAEVLNKYVGESEKNVRDLFKRAGSLAPCVIFFDEIDSLCPKRSSSSEDGSMSRVTNQLLLEMSGLEQRTEVYVIAATNRLDRLDPAFLRPGRMDKIIYVGLPTPEGRVEILKALTKNGTRPKLAADVDLDLIGIDKRCDGFSGADLGNLVQVARETCLEQIIETTEPNQVYQTPSLTRAHFEVAFESVSASVDAQSKRNYEAMRKLLNKQKSKSEMAAIDADLNADSGSSINV